MSESNPSSLHATLNRLSMEPPVSYQLTGVSASLPIEWTASFKGKGGRGGGVGLASAGWHEEGGGAGAAGGTCWCNFLALPRMDYDYDKSEESGTQAKVHDKFDKYSQTMRVTTCVARFVGVTPHVRVRMFMFTYVCACSCSCTCTHVRVRVRVRMFVFVYVHACSCSSTCTHVRMILRAREGIGGCMMFTEHGRIAE